MGNISDIIALYCSIIEGCEYAVYQILNELLVKTSGPKKVADNNVKTLMLLHGWGMNSHVWETVRDDLESKYHVLWVDLPGHGVNRHLAAKSLENMVRLIAEITPVNTHVIGWSLGGMVAQALAQLIPDRVNSLTLVASTPRFSQLIIETDTNQTDTNQTALSQNINSSWQHAMSDTVLNRFANNLKQDPVKTIKGFIALQFIGVEDSKEAQNNLIQHILFNKQAKSELKQKPNAEVLPEKWGGVLSNDDLDVNQSSFQSGDNIPTQEALDTGLTILKEADLRSLTPSCPEHWIFAEYDRLIPKEVINDLISLRPNAEITMLERMGHAPFITHSETFLKHAIDFIESQPKDST